MNETCGQKNAGISPRFLVRELPGHYAALSIVDPDFASSR